jgi:predicted ATP-binding protein involved in virulence
VRLAAIQLSQGYQAMLAWVADVIGQVVLEAAGAIPLEEMEGLLLIDEIDLHLHPRWQVGLVKTLRQIFPRMQFVTTTHSPMVLPYLHQDELFLLSQDDAGNITAQPASQSPAFLTGGGIYAKFFGLPEIFPPQLSEMLWRYGGLAANPRRSPADTAELSRLRDQIIAAGLDPGPDPLAAAAAREESV